MSRLVWLHAVVLVCACGHDRDVSVVAPDESEIGGEPLSSETVLGPITATVRVVPAQPRLGDVIQLTLEVVAEPDVDVEMPIFGEALGRHTILSFTPRRSQDAAGATTHSQTYRIQASSSGRLRVPRLRVVFRDPGGAGDGTPEERELLTDEIALAVASVLPEEGDGELRPPRAPLAEDIGASPLRWIVGASAGGVLVLVGVVLIVLRRRRSVEVEVVDPYQRALAGLAELEAQGLPNASEADLFYVQLSGIVRRYLEDRFGLRAPELTTEEFLREAQRSAQLSPDHRTLLARFLADCDRVKFAGYRPETDEAQSALETARRFIEEAHSGSGQEEAA